MMFKISDGHRRDSHRFLLFKVLLFALQRSQSYGVQLGLGCVAARGEHAGNFGSNHHATEFGAGKFSAGFVEHVA